MYEAVVEFRMMQKWEATLRVLRLHKIRKETAIAGNCTISIDLPATRLHYHDHTQVFRCNLWYFKRWPLALEISRWAYAIHAHVTVIPHAALPMTSMMRWSGLSAGFKSAIHFTPCTQKCIADHAQKVVIQCEVDV